MQFKEFSFDKATINSASELWLFLLIELTEHAEKVKRWQGPADVCGRLESHMNQERKLHPQHPRKNVAVICKLKCAFNGRL